MSNVFGPKKPLFGPYTYRAKQNSNGDTLIAVYHGSKRIAHIDAYWAYSMRAIEEHEAEEAQRASGSGGTRRRLVCASDLRALGAEGRYPNVLRVGHAFVDDEAYKGKGIGRAMYEAMMAEGFAVRETRISGQPGPMFLIPDECGGAGNTSADAKRVWASLARDYPSQGTSIRVDAPPVIGSRAKSNPRRRNPANPLSAVVSEAEEASRWFEPRAARWREEDREGGNEDYIGLDDMGLVVPARQTALKQRFGSRLLGSGVFRTVVAASDTRFVIKLAMRPSDNLAEAAFWQHAGPRTREMLVPVVAVDPKGRWLIMERATPLPSQQENSPAMRAACVRAKAVGLLDIHASNLSSDFRILDYAEPVSSQKTLNPRRPRRPRVSAAERTRILREITESVKDEMQRTGWWTDDEQGRPVQRFDRPSEWDINNGMCEEWAETAERRLGGEAVDLAYLRYEKFGLPADIFEDVAHVVLLLDGRFYDAQDPQGVSDPRKLHLIRRVSREEFIKGRTNPRRNLDAEVWYHGRKARSRKFDLQFVGGREATNQEGPGFYFTTSSEDASAYAYPNGIVLRAALNVPKWVSRTKRPVRSEIERLMRAAPDYEDALMDWDESPHRAHAKALASIMREPNQHAAFLTTWAEFYRRSGHSADYLRELASMGYGGVKARRGESQHAVVFSPAFVENVEVLEDLGTGPIENPRRQNYPRVVVALDQHLPQATAQVEAGFYFEEGGCVGMALALQRTLQRYGVTAPLALFPGSFKHAGVLVGKRFLDATGLGLQEVAAAPITRSRLLGVAKEWGKKAEDVLSDQEYAQQAIDLALEEGG